MMNSLLQYYVLRRHDDTFDFHFYNANEYANECEQLSSSLCTVVVMSYGAKLLIVNLNISLYQPWKVHGLHEFIFFENFDFFSKCQRGAVTRGNIFNYFFDFLVPNASVHKKINSWSQWTFHG